MRSESLATTTSQSQRRIERCNERWQKNSLRCGIGGKMMKFIEHLNKHTIGQMNGKNWDFIVHFDISHNALSWQRARKKQYDSSAKPRLEQASGTLMAATWIQRSNQSSQEPSDCRRTRCALYSSEVKDSSKQHTESWTSRILGMAEFQLGGVLCETGKFRTPATMPNMVEFVILGPKNWQKWHSHGWEDKEWCDKW